MYRISFNTANYVARQVNYHMTKGWAEGNDTTEAYYKPLKTFHERFSDLLLSIRKMGFKSLDLWMAMLNPSWTTDNHILIVKKLLKQYNLSITSFAGQFGTIPSEFERSCQIATELNVKTLGGVTPVFEQNREFVILTLKKYKLKLGIENHKETTPEEMLIKIGDGGKGTIGTTIDTGWYTTHNYDVTRAIRKLNEYIFHIHLKDILESGKHETCRFGEGIVPIEDCVKTLKLFRYEGGFSIEHEPELYNPTEDCKASLVMLRDWLKS